MPEAPDRIDGGGDNTGEFMDFIKTEGWSLYSHEVTGAVHVERSDFTQRTHKRDPVFETDAEALEWVKERAEEGSEPHQRALRRIVESKLGITHLED